MIKWYNIQNFISRVSMRLRRNIMKMVGFRIQENYFLDSPFWGPKENVKRIGIYSEIQDVVIPQFLERNDKFTFSFPRRYIYEISNAIIDPMTGLVYDSEGKLIAESSTWNFQRLLFDIPKPRIKIPQEKLDGQYVFMPTITNYYHWLVEDLPVFLSSYQKKKEAQILMGAQNFPPINAFMTKYLSDDLIKCQVPVQVERLILTAKNAGMGNPISSSNVVHPHDLKIIKEWFSEYIVSGSVKNDNKVMIYLSRSKAKKRKMEGEELLEDELKKLGFIIFHGNISLFEQIELFSSACVIMGAQGASMTNLVWVPKKTKVIEIHQPNNYAPYFYNMGMMLDLDYNFLEVPKESWTTHDIENIVAHVKELL